jgi:hypothetical protein
MKVRSVVLVLAIAFMFVSAPGVLAHEGHMHRLMGTVAAIQGERLQVKETTGKMSEVVLNDKTRILRGTTAQTAADIKPGDRIVVTMAESKDEEGKALLTAKEIRLGTSQASRR